MQTDLNEIFSHFDIETNFTPYGNGHINDTYVTSGKPRYILQRINTKIFTDPEGLMNNVQLVTEYLREIIKSENGNPERETLTVVPTVDNKPFFRAKNGDCYRLYIFIEDTVTLQQPENRKQLEAVGKAFGRFQKQLKDFPAEKLVETIKDFHNTPKRFQDFKTAVENNSFGRAAFAKDEIEFALSRGESCGIIHEGIQNGTIPLRVTHNDTKINNVLLEPETFAPVCVIDLDTVMPGSMLYDFGDALRTGGTPAAEDEQDLDKVYFDLRLFKSFAQGFLAETKDSITESEFKLLPESVKILTYECGIRFLGDYLNGDTYFKTKYATHNLDRARTQFKLVADIEKKLDEMHSVLESL